MSVAQESIVWTQGKHAELKLPLEKIDSELIMKIIEGFQKFPVQEKGQPLIYPSVEHNPDGASIKYNQCLSIDVLYMPEVLSRMSQAKTGIATMSYDVYCAMQEQHSLQTLIRLNYVVMQASTQTNVQRHFNGDGLWQFDPTKERMNPVPGSAACPGSAAGPGS